MWQEVLDLDHATLCNVKNKKMRKNEKKVKKVM